MSILTDELLEKALEQWNLGPKVWYGSPNDLHRLNLRRVIAAILPDVIEACAKEFDNREQPSAAAAIRALAQPEKETP